MENTHSHVIAQEPSAQTILTLGRALIGHSFKATDAQALLCASCHLYGYQEGRRRHRALLKQSRWLARSKRDSDPAALLARWLEVAE